ncbi:MAG: dTDP-4-dehydrorhamnose 3,5-epimerase [Verrucomicrobia bacterium]|nr:dTDP-4-dehydrorhamnose 3,5-epimerase [Verrucomicrobiota bacterium]
MQLLKDLIFVQPKVFKDERGFFVEIYQKERYQKLGIDVEFVQDNHSYSKKGVIRGMHFQRGQAKLVSCPKGRIFDVAVDLREDSPDFGKWTGVILDGEKQEQLYIPDGFAHGFAVLSEEAHVLYKLSSLYDKDCENGFRFDDPQINIKWPILHPILSMRDEKALSFSEVV